MPEFEQLIRHEEDPREPAPTLDQLFHRTRVSERSARMAWGVAGALAVVAVTLLATVWVALSLYANLAHRRAEDARVAAHRTAVRLCKDDVFALTADTAFTTGKYPSGYIIREYQRCEADPDHKIPHP